MSPKQELTNPRRVRLFTLSVAKANAPLENENEAKKLIKHDGWRSTIKTDDDDDQNEREREQCKMYQKGIRKREIKKQ